jgi:hypothetical protein
LPPCQSFLTMSPVLRRELSNTCLIALWPSVPSPVVSDARGPPKGAMCRHDKPRHIAKGSLSIDGYRLREGLVEHADRVAAPQKILGTKKMKIIYNNTGKVDRLLSIGHRLLSHLGHLRAKIWPGTLRPCTPIDTPICNVCRRSSEVTNCEQPQ